MLRQTSSIGFDAGLCFSDHVVDPNLASDWQRPASLKVDDRERCAIQSTSKKSWGVNYNDKREHGRPWCGTCKSREWAAKDGGWKDTSSCCKAGLLAIKEMSHIFSLTLALLRSFFFVGLLLLQSGHSPAVDVQYAQYASCCDSVSLGYTISGYSRARDAWAFWHFKSLPPLPPEGGSDDAGSVYGRLDHRSKLMAAGIVVVGKHAGGVPFARPCFAPKWMVIVEAADEEADEQQLEWTIVSSIDVRGLCRNVEPHHLLPCKRANNMLFLHLLDRPVAFNLDTRAWHLHVPRWNVNREESVWNVAYVPSLTAPPDNDGRPDELEWVLGCYDGVLVSLLSALRLTGTPS
ncbi:hypothetical protein SELMODRAFT_407391 [Selaginella moellendorffii]|uniref:Uncharacterized protein n=1 Tax=Selaginella moellendorffii TaxID=88036 RepID=D8R5G2_SELML|nr:hypothetical protein SELMODRAFT_407391 [Selaginella moellendorffii]